MQHAACGTLPSVLIAFPRFILTTDDTTQRNVRGTQNFCGRRCGEQSNYRNPSRLDGDDLIGLVLSKIKSVNLNHGYR